LFENLLDSVKTEIEKDFIYSEEKEQRARLTIAFEDFKERISEQIFFE
jgi:hypothetical protein